MPTVRAYGQIDPLVVAPGPSHKPREVDCHWPVRAYDHVIRGVQEVAVGYTAAREHRIEGKIARSVVRKTRISENYEARISHIGSDISRFSGGTILLSLKLARVLVKDRTRGEMLRRCGGAKNHRNLTYGRV